MSSTASASASGPASEVGREEGVDRRNDDIENKHYAENDHDHHDEHDHRDDDSIQNIPGFTEEDERRELASLSMNDIAEVQSDLCGFSSLFSSSCILGQHALAGPNLPAAIANLNHEMSRLPSVETSAYYRAVEVCPGQVRPERKLVFLEYAHGNAREAARALAEYWRGRLDLFGPDKAFRPMTLTGALKEDAMAMTRRQVVQLVPVTDTAGRAILFFSPSRRRLDEYTIEQELQAVWYLFEAVLENANLRKNGVVVICDLRGVQRKHIRRVTRYVRVWQTIDSCLPVDIRGMHCCYPTSAFYYLIFPVVKRLASKSIRLHLKLHYGEDSSVLTNLAGFCLTRDRLPTEFGGDVHLDMNQWMLNRISLEATRRSLEGAGLSSDPRSRRGCRFHRRRRGTTCIFYFAIAPSKEGRSPPRRRASRWANKRSFFISSTTRPNTTDVLYEAKTKAASAKGTGIGIFQEYIGPKAEGDQKAQEGNPRSQTGQANGPGGADQAVESRHAPQGCFAGCRICLQESRGQDRPCGSEWRVPLPKAE